MANHSRVPGVLANLNLALALFFFGLVALDWLSRSRMPGLRAALDPVVFVVSWAYLCLPPLIGGVAFALAKKAGQPRGKIIGGLVIWGVFLVFFLITTVTGGHGPAG